MTVTELVLITVDCCRFDYRELHNTPLENRTVPDPNLLRTATRTRTDTHTRSEEALQTVQPIHTQHRGINKRNLESR